MVSPGTAAAGYQAVVPDDGPGYLLRLPADYDATERRYPLLLFLHGIVQKGSGSPQALERVADHGPFRTMRDGEWDGSLPLIVIGPQSDGIWPWWRGDRVLAALDHALATYRVDETRLYLSGISMGGNAIWWLAGQRPGRFAALLPVSAWAGSLRDACARYGELPVWAFHGDSDPVVSLASGQRPITALAACGSSPASRATLTVLEATGHGGWARVYANHHGTSNVGGDGRGYADVYRWLLSHRRLQPKSARDTTETLHPEGSGGA